MTTSPLADPTTSHLPSPSRRRYLAAGMGLPWLAATPSLMAQPARFPERALTIVVPFGAGGIADLTARAVGEALAQRLGQPVVIDNKPSAGSIVASQAVLSARPDGHTLLLMSNGHAVSVGLFKKLPYDVQKDFAAVSTLGSFDLGIFAAANSRHASLPAALTFARANPGKLTVGTIAAGSTQHLAAKLFETVTGIEALVVPYKGSPAVITALRAGEVDLAFEIVGPMLPQVAAGAVRALAVTSRDRNPALPQVSTVQQLGVPGYEVASWNALAVHAATPAEVVASLNRAVREAVAQASVQEKLGSLGMRVAGSSATELQALLGSEIKRWGEVIRTARIEPE